MKRSSPSQCLVGALLAFLFSVSAAGQLITGLKLTETVSALIPWCALISAVCAVLFCFKYGWCAVLALSLCGTYYLFADTDIVKQLSTLLFKLTSGYAKVYGTRTFGINKTNEAFFALLFIASATAVLVSFCICRRKRVWPALAAAVFPFAVLLPVKLTLPDALYMYLSMVGIAVLLITDRPRRKQPKHFAPLALRSFAAAAAAFALLFVLNPQESYVNRVARLNDRLESIFGGAGSSFVTIINGGSSGNSLAASIDLRVLGPKNDADYEVMTVKATFTDTVYLRGRDYDIYNGIDWISSEGRLEKTLKGTGVLGTLTVTTKGKESCLYVPYYPNNVVTLTNGYLKNENKEKEYTFTVAGRSIGYAGSLAVSYTELPAETLEWAVPIASGLTEGKRYASDKAAAIAEYVKGCAVYDTKTSAMMNKGDDFAKWFLFESETGYCAHYATAATVLLRAAGIPARYVEGYYVQCIWDEELSVSNRRAHAWVEYYDSTANTWHVLEATPAEALALYDSPSENEPAQTDEPVTEDTTPPDVPVTDEPAVTDTPQTDEPQTPDDIGDVIGNNTQNNEKTPVSVPKWVKRLLWTAIVLSAMQIQASIRIYEKRRRWNGKAPNKAALARYVQCGLSAKITHTAVPDKLADIALKAKFSQHTVTERELAEFEMFRKKLLAKINKMPWYKKLVMRWVFAVG